MREKQEDRALATGQAGAGPGRRVGRGRRCVIIKSKKVKIRHERGRRLVGEAKNQKDCTS